VPDHEKADEDEADKNGVGLQPWHEARDRVDPGGRGRRDREYVVDEKSGGRDEAGYGAEVVARDDVASAAVRVCLDHLRLREDHDREDADDRDRDRGQEDERSNTSEGKDAHGLFGRVRRRGDVVRPEDRETGVDREPLRLVRLHAEALPEKEAADGLVRAPSSAFGLEQLLVRDVAVAASAKTLGAVQLDVAISR